VSHENVEIVRRAMELQNPREYADLKLYAPDIIYRPLAIFTESNECRGLEEYLRFGQGYFADWAEDFTTRVTSVRDYGDVVTTRTELNGHARASGIAVSSVIFKVVWLRDGLISRVEDFATSAEALNAAGVEE
jgi:ketosteroid isomerase-like protein